MSGHSQFYLQNFEELHSKSQLVKEIINSLKSNVSNELLILSDALDTAINIMKNHRLSSESETFTNEKSPLSA